ncbi:pre-mRNA-splicing factor CWC22 [Marchantia polymorpha subsp. ruderalis]
MGRGKRSGSSSSSGSDLAPRRTKNEKKDDDRGGGAEEARGEGGSGGGGGGQWSSQGGAGDRKGAGAAIGSDDEDSGRRDGYRRGSDASKSSRDRREQGLSERHRDGGGRQERAGRESEQWSRVRSEGGSERGKERLDSDAYERGRYDSERVRRDRYDPDSSRSEREKRQRTDRDRDRSDRDGDGRDRSYSRNESSRERQRGDRDERPHRGRDYSREEDEEREFSRPRAREIARNAEERDVPSRARGKEPARIEDSRDLLVKSGERESPRSVKESELHVRGGTLEESKESSRARGRETADDGERVPSYGGRDRERESPRRGSGSKNEPEKSSGRPRMADPKEEEQRDDDAGERARWPRRERESSPEVGEIELAKSRRNEFSEERRVRARRDNDVDRAIEREEGVSGRRGKVRKEREHSSDEEDRSTRRRVDDDPLVAVGRGRGVASETPAGALADEDLSLSLAVRTAKDEAGRVESVEMAVEKVRNVHSESSPSPTRSKALRDREKPALQINVDNHQLGRIASPSPKTKPNLPSASESETGGSDSSRGASPAMSLTPERATFTKPTRATPDIRRGERSPNPSPLSPRSRLPPPGALGALSPIVPSKLAEEGVPGEIVGTGVDDNLDAPSALNGDEEISKLKRHGGDVKPTVNMNEGEGLLEDGETLDRWVPEDDGDELPILSRGGNGNASPMDYANEGRNRSSHRENRWNDRRDSGRGDRRTARDDSNMGDNSAHGSGRGRYGDQGRYGGDEMATSRGRYNDTSRQRNSDDFERGVRGDSERDGYRRNGEQMMRNRERGRDAERKQAVNGDVAGPKHEKQIVTKLGEKVEPVAEVKKVERERPQLPPGRSGGVYIPPFKLAQMLKEVDDKSSNEYQRLTWDALRKSINGLVNKVNASNLKNILPELFSENLIRGRGLFARSCMKSQMASPTFTHVFAALVAVVNTKFPELGELLLKRIILQLRRAFKRNDKPVLLAAAKFIAHLVNQQVAHEILALELLTVLLENPTDDSVEVAVGFVKECGAVLQNLSSQGLHAIFERFRGILHEGEIDKRVQFMIEGLFAIRKAKFQGFAGVLPELDLVEEEDQITHELSLEDDLDDESYLDVFKPDPNFVEAEKKYEAIKRDILGDESEEDAGEDGDKDDDEEDSDEEDEEDEDEREQRMQIQDETETNLVNLRRTIYLTIMSSVDFEEAGHKLLKIKLEPGQEMELCIMLLECCSQERTYLRYYGLLGQRFCLINRVYQENFDQCFVKQYSMIHRLETNKLRNVAKFFAHLLGTDALPWQALAYIRLTEEDTTSSSRIFIKILFQELSEHLGLRKLNERLSDPMMQESFDGIFPKDNPKNTRFAINFFTSIGLGGLTDSLREYLKNMPRLIMQQHPTLPSESEDSSSESDGSGSGTDSDSSTESDTVSDDSSDSDSDSDGEAKKRRKRKHK